MDDQWSFVCNGTLRGYEEFLERFVGEAVQKEQRQGTYLLRQGDPAACLYLLLSGVVENSVFLEDGRKKINMLYTGKSLLGISSMDSDVSQVNLEAGPAAAGSAQPDLQNAGGLPAAQGAIVSVHGGAGAEDT